VYAQGTAAYPDPASAAAAAAAAALKAPTVGAALLFLVDSLRKVQGMDGNQPAVHVMNMLCGCVLCVFMVSAAKDKCSDFST